MTQDIKKIIRAAKAGGKILEKYFGRELEITQKSTIQDLVTKADKESEKVIIKILSQEFPQYNIFGEESGLLDRKSDHIFIIDPLDGSHNFVSGIPNFSVSIGLLKNDEVISAVICHPVINHIYSAEKNKGAWLGGKKLRVNKIKDIKRASIAYGRGYIEAKTKSDKIEINLNKAKPRRVFQNWSLAYDFCLLASGKIEAVIVNGNDDYDFVAGKLIARQAGALITDFAGQPEKNDKNRFFVASNGAVLHKHLLKVIKK